MQEGYQLSVNILDAGGGCRLRNPSILVCCAFFWGLETAIKEEGALDSATKELSVLILGLDRHPG